MILVQGLAYAEKKVELFTAQVEILEEEVRSRDLLLREVRDEMVRSTDALKLASHIKQVILLESALLFKS